MFELPPLDQLAPGAVILGLLFALRLVLAVRRLRGEAEGRAGFSIADLSRVRQAGAYGDDVEPNRRYALRQLVMAALLLGIGGLLLAWLLVADVLGPFVLRAFAV